MTGIVRYPLARRLLHWTIAALILVTAPIGLTMAGRAEANIFDDLTNTLYAWHKGIGFLILLLMIPRISLLVILKSPAYPQWVAPRVQVAARLLHYAMYVLLVAAPLMGWAGVTAFPALGTVAGLSLPPMPWIPQSEELAAQLFEVHEILTLSLLTLVTGHILAALTHLLIRKDGLFSRMGFR